ncbi:J domain-containing protein [Natronorubrum texcoconense]|uniref:DnaJ domain-containing protein n=1 Tax=Natronorubrum texcoconense TaxID=1095776 RepID=A0A1G8ZQU3_9EURY|nr:J domain-containing protein [Natronorubrum texcoconense]SDK17438.1 DnaJ domain-containing protein [Natronorubrum texcoconense]
MGQTYYDILEVDPDATRAEIQTAYRERVLETHPDHNDAPDAAAQFKRVSTARSVLTDGTERARYDRLGHDAYVRLAERSSGASSPDSSASDGTGDSTREPDSSSETETTSSTRSGSTSRGSTGGGSDGRNRRGDGRRGSHHARQRARRQRKTAQQRAGGGWTFVTEGGGDSSRESSANNGSAASNTASAAGASGATSAGATAGTRAADASGSTSGAGMSAGSNASDADASSGFRYTVHDWEGEVDLEWEGQAMPQTTAVTIGCLWLLYPLFVAASVTPLFPLAINAIVAACTFAFVGYLLTRPRIATAVFGFWSVLFPLGIDQLASVSAFSITGLVALGFAWVPFGYAVALWWALRP